MKYNFNDIGGRIKKERSDRNLSLEELASKLNVTRQTLSAWERGGRRNKKEKADPNDNTYTYPSLEDFLNLCEIFDCELDYLLCEIDCTEKNIQYIHEYTGLSEEAIKNLNVLANGKYGREDDNSQLAVINTIAGDKGLELLAYLALVRGLKLRTDKLLAEVLETTDLDDIGTVYDSVSVLEGSKNRLASMEGNATEAFQRFLDEALDVGTTRTLMNREYTKLIKVLLS